MSNTGQIYDMRNGEKKVDYVTSTTEYFHPDKCSSRSDQGENHPRVPVVASFSNSSRISGSNKVETGWRTTGFAEKNQTPAWIDMGWIGLLLPDWLIKDGIIVFQLLNERVPTSTMKNSWSCVDQGHARS